MRGAALRMKLESALGCLARLRRHSHVVMDVNRFDPDRLADAGDAAVDRGPEGLTIEWDLAPSQGATQGALHSACDGGQEVVERRGNRRPFLDAVILAERSLDAVDDGFPHLAEIGVAVPLTVLEAGVRNDGGLPSIPFDGPCV